MGMLQRFREQSWRWIFAIGAILMLAGGPMHPRGTMVEMLADPAWPGSHTLLLVGFIALVMGLVRFRREVTLVPSTAKWARWATIATALQAFEMLLHTLSYLDHAHLVAGASTPILSSHLALAVVVYPIFSIAWVGLIVSGWQHGELGSRWIGWMGLIGLIGHGAAAPLAVLTTLSWAALLFPLVLLFGLWMLLAACTGGAS